MSVRPIPEPAWRCFIEAVCDDLERLEEELAAAGHEGELDLDRALALVNEALTRSGAALSVMESSGPADELGEEEWRDGYLSGLVSVAALAYLGSRATLPPHLDGDEAVKVGFETILALGDEFARDQAQPDIIHWHLLVVQQAYKLVEAVRTLDRAGRGDEESQAEINAIETLGSPGEYARTVPLLFSMVGGAVLATVSALAPDGFAHVPELGYRV